MDHLPYRDGKYTLLVSDLKIVCTHIPIKRIQVIYLSFQPFLLPRLAQLLLYNDSLSS